MDEGNDVAAVGIIDQPAGKVGALGKKTFAAGVWNFGGTFIRYFVSLAISVVLARLLTPQEYGVVGLLNIFFVFTGLITECGFDFTILQRKELNERLLSSIFWYKMAASSLFYVLFCVLRYPMAKLFNCPELAEIIPYAALSQITLAIGGNNIHLMRRELRFKALMMIAITSGIISGIVGIIMAYMGQGVWALVFSTLLGNILYSGGAFAVTHWVPRWQFDWKALREVLPFSSKAFGSCFVGAVFSNIFGLVIGKCFPLSELAFYNKGKFYAKILVANVGESLGNVCLPSLSRLQDNPKRLNQAVLRMLDLSLFVSVFPSALLLALGRPFIILVFTEKWLPMLPFMYIMFGGQIFVPLSKGLRQAAFAVGRSDIPLKIEMVNRTVCLLGILMTFKMGVYYLICIESFALFSETVLYMLLIRRVTHIDLYRFVSMLSKNMLFALGTACGVRLLWMMHPEVSWLNFIGLGAVGCVAFATLCFVFRLNGLVELSGLTVQFLPRLRNNWFMRYLNN